MKTVRPCICLIFSLYPCAVKGKPLMAHIKDFFIATPESVPYEGREKFIPK